MWYPDTPRHYTIPSSFARHYFLESDRTIHGRQRAFQVTETETGILQVIYLKSNWVLFVLYFQYGSHASCLRKEGRNRTEFFFFLFLHFAPLYKWFLLQQLNPIFVVLDLQPKKSTYKRFQCDFTAICCKITTVSELAANLSETKACIELI